MEIKIYQVDAFTNQVFGGNPAAICLLQEWLPDAVMQNIATENNLPETAFLIEKENDYLIRWFTPTKEVDLCGHATLASAYVVFNYLQPELQKIIFRSLSGPLKIIRRGEEMQMDFPALPIEPITPPEKLTAALNVTPIAVYRSTDYLVIVDSVKTLQRIEPDHRLLKQLDLRGVIVSALAEEKNIDFVSRFFAPKLNILEDPITGSAHCSLVPYWSNRLNKNVFNSHQLTERNIKLRCELVGNRVLLLGTAVPYLEGTIRIPH